MPINVEDRAAALEACKQILAEGGMPTPAEVADRAGLRKPAAKHQLVALREAGIVPPYRRELAASGKVLAACKDLLAEGIQPTRLKVAGRTGLPPNRAEVALKYLRMKGVVPEYDPALSPESYHPGLLTNAQLAERLVTLRARTRELGRQPTTSELYAWFPG